jgi:hypothetical protein
MAKQEKSRYKASQIREPVPANRKISINRQRDRIQIVDVLGDHATRPHHRPTACKPTSSTTRDEGP